MCPTVQNLLNYGYTFLRLAVKLFILCVIAVMTDIILRSYILGLTNLQSHFFLDSCRVFRNSFMSVIESNPYSGLYKHIYGLFIKKNINLIL